MLALRRVVNPARSQRFVFGAASKLFISGSEIEQVCLTVYSSKQTLVCSETGLMLKGYLSQSFLLGNHCFASHAGARSDEEVEEGEGESTDGETEHSDNDKEEKGKDNSLFQVIKGSNLKLLHKALSDYFRIHKPVDRSMILETMSLINKRHMNSKAKLFVEWLEENEGFYDEREYAFRLDIISRFSRTNEAENYFRSIPKSFKGQNVYDALLTSFVRQMSWTKAEELFEKMKDMNLVSASTCDMMLVLYKRNSASKLADILAYMKKNHINPTLRTYKVLVESKGFRDIQGLEEVLHNMKADGIKADKNLNALIARYYIHAGYNEKGEEIMKKLELGNLDNDRDVCGSLLRLYAQLGKSDDVDRIWKICMVKAWKEVHQGAIQAYAKLDRLDEAEEIYNGMRADWKNDAAHELLTAYMDKKMLEKAKAVADGIVKSQAPKRQYIWNALLKYYMESDQMEKADQTMAQMSRVNMKPMYVTYFSVMEQYAKKGDIHNSERIFLWVRRSGYLMKSPIYCVLADAYINAKTPLYGLRERLKADNVIPNRDLVAKLAQTDAFRRTEKVVH